MQKVLVRQKNLSAANNLESRGLLDLKKRNLHPGMPDEVLWSILNPPIVQ